MPKKIYTEEELNKMTPQERYNALSPFASTVSADKMFAKTEIDTFKNAFFKPLKNSHLEMDNTEIRSAFFAWALGTKKDMTPEKLFDLSDDEFKTLKNEFKEFVAAKPASGPEFDKLDEQQKNERASEYASIHAAAFNKIKDTKIPSIKGLSQSEVEKVVFDPKHMIFEFMGNTLQQNFLNLPAKSPIRNAYNSAFNKVAGGKYGTSTYMDNLAHFDSLMYTMRTTIHPEFSEKEKAINKIISDTILDSEFKGKNPGEYIDRFNTIGLDINLAYSNDYFKNFTDEEFKTLQSKSLSDLKKDDTALYEKTILEFDKALPKNEYFSSTAKEIKERLAAEAKAKKDRDDKVNSHTNDYNNIIKKLNSEGHDALTYHPIYDYIYYKDGLFDLDRTFDNILYNLNLDFNNVFGELYENQKEAYNAFNKANRTNYDFLDNFYVSDPNATYKKIPVKNVVKQLVNKYPDHFKFDVDEEKYARAIVMAELISKHYIAYKPYLYEAVGNDKTAIVRPEYGDDKLYIMSPERLKEATDNPNSYEAFNVKTAARIDKKDKEYYSGLAKSERKYQEELEKLAKEAKIKEEKDAKERAEAEAEEKKALADKQKKEFEDNRAEMARKEQELREKKAEEEIRKKVLEEQRKAELENEAEELKRIEEEIRKAEEERIKLAIRDNEINCHVNENLTKYSDQVGKIISLDIASVIKDGEFTIKAILEKGNKKFNSKKAGKTEVKKEQEAEFTLNNINTNIKVKADVVNEIQENMNRPDNVKDNYGFSQGSLGEYRSDLNKRHWIKFIGGGASHELGFLKHQIDRTIEIINKIAEDNKKTLYNENNSRLRDELIEKIKKAAAKYIAEKRGKKHANDTTWEPSTRMGKARFKAAKNILKFCEDYEKKYKLADEVKRDITNMTYDFTNNKEWSNLALDVDTKAAKTEAEKNAVVKEINNVAYGMLLGAVAKNLMDKEGYNYEGAKIVTIEDLDKWKENAVFKSVMSNIKGNNDFEKAVNLRSKLIKNDGTDFIKEFSKATVAAKQAEDKTKADAEKAKADAAKQVKQPKPGKGLGK
ncbi:MAG: hypothetical protein K5656_03095 [Lachnospiraceae bacterium]|nr:hypothetical protein [Lachnospiraceae bacterium]